MEKIDYEVDNFMYYCDYKGLSQKSMRSYEQTLRLFIGTHKMRKTFGYWHYQQYKDVAILQEIFNHSSPSVTLRYIGINQDNIDKSYMNFSL